MRYLFLLFFLITSQSIISQIRVSGTVTDTRNNPVAGVSISIENSYDGATTDSVGRFSFTTSETGAHVIVVSHASYKGFSQPVLLEKDSLFLPLVLKEKMTELNAVVISAGAFIAGDQKKAAALSSLDIATNANANADITEAVKSLPGAQQIGEKEGLFVRGGTAQETKYYIDGNLVNKFFYSSSPGLASRGRFNPFLFSGTVFSSGGYSAAYGQALSSVLLLESTDLPDKSSASFGLTVLSASGGFQHLAKNKKSSFGATYGYSNLSLAFSVIPQKQDYFTMPENHEGDFNFRIKTSKRGMLKFYGMISGNKVGFRAPDIDSLALKDAFSLSDFNYFQSLSWKEKLNGNWQLHAGVSYTNSKDKLYQDLQNEANAPITIAGNELYLNKHFRLRSIGQYANAKVVLEKRVQGLSTIRFGSEYNYSKESGTYYPQDQGGQAFAQTNNTTSLFAEGDIYISPKLAARTGVRTEHASLIDRWNIAPRLSLAYQFADKSQASLAYGSFYQTPDGAYFPAVATIQFEKATHYIAQYLKISRGYTFRAEAFYKKYTDLVKTSPSFAGEKAQNNNGYGDAKGIEIFWRDKKTLRNVDYWISYSYLDTKRDYLYYPSAITPPFFARHTASLVVKKFVLPIKTQFNASYTLSSPRKYYDFVRVNNETQIRQQGHTNVNSNLSLSINYVPSVGNTKAKSFSVLVVSVSNLLGSNPVYSYQFSADGRNKQAITPPAKRFVFVGWFISLGIDRSEDAINNHL